jgi:glycosyltransferase involved in cell wall biosynthesis
LFPNEEGEVSASRPGSGEPIRIVRLIARMNIGGPALHVSLLTERLDPECYTSLLVTGTEAPHEGNYLALYGKRLERVIVIPGLGRELRGGQDAVALRAIVRLLRTFRPHVVHTHTAKAGTLGRLAARWCRVPVVVHTYHGHVLRGYFGPVRSRLFVAIERWLARHTDRLLAVSERVRRDLLDLGIGRPERFSVMPLGLDLERFLDAGVRRGQLRRELGLTEGELLVGIVGRLVGIKAHELFLQTAAAVAERLPHSRFIVVGDGERRAELEALSCRLGLGARVRFLGWRHDLDTLYADMDVVALTSRHEGSPVALIEAMAAARPVVASAVGGVPELVEDGISGYLVPPGDVAGFARAIERVLMSPDRGRTLGETARRRVHPAFGAGRLVNDMDALYRELLERSGSWPEAMQWPSPTR